MHPTVRQTQTTVSGIQAELNKPSKASRSSTDLTQEFYTLNPKRRQNSAARSADKVFLGSSFQLQLDKKVSNRQHYSLCWRLEQRVLWISCMFRPELCVSTPPITVHRPTPCFQVRQNHKQFGWKTASRHKTLCDTIPGPKCRLIKITHSECCFFFFFFRFFSAS